MFVRQSLIALCLLTSASLGFADTVNRFGPTQVISKSSLAAILRSMGQTVEDKTQPGGSPWLVATTKNGAVFNAFLYICGDNPMPSSPCEQLQLRMLWDNTKGRTTDDVNRFHLEKVFGRGYLSEDRKIIGVEYALHIKGGVTIANLKENIDYFLRVTDDFNEIVKP